MSQEHTSPVFERFVSAQAAADFLAIERRFLLSLARKGIAGAYAIGTGEMRKTWVFKLSELAAAIDPKAQIKTLFRHPVATRSGYDPIRRFPLK